MKNKNTLILYILVNSVLLGTSCSIAPSNSQNNSNMISHNSYFDTSGDNYTSIDISESSFISDSSNSEYSISGLKSSSTPISSSEEQSSNVQESSEPVDSSSDISSSEEENSSEPVNSSEEQSSNVVYHEDINREQFNTIESDGVLYRLSSEEDGYIVVGIADDYSFTEINILNYLNNKKVVEIGERAFASQNNCKKITIPENIKKINNLAFPLTTIFEEILIDENNKNFVFENGVLYGYEKTELLFISKSIDSMALPASLKKITHPTMISDSKLNEISVDDNNPYFSSEDGVLYNFDKTTVIAFPPKKEAEQFLLHFGTKCIAQNSFRRTTSLGKITIPETVERIEEYAFELSDVQEIVFSGGKIYLEDYAMMSCYYLKNIDFNCDFSYCDFSSMLDSYLSSLETINILKNGIDFCSINGVVYDKEMNSLLFYPDNNKETSYVLPKTVKKVLSTFSRNLLSISIHDSIEEINDYAFSKCLNIESYVEKESLYIGDSTNKCLILFDTTGVDDKNLTINKKCKFVLETAFLNKKNKNIMFEMFQVEEENEYFCADQYGLYNKEKTTLFKHCALDSQEIVLADSVVSISDNCFLIKKDSVIVGASFNDFEKLFLQLDIVNIEINSNRNCVMENGILFNKDMTVVYRYFGEATDISIPSSVIFITANAFKYSKIKSINLNYGLVEISECAFYGCYYLQHISFPNTLKKIGNRAFFDCYLLEKLLFNKGLEHIGNSAFFGCKSLCYISIPFSLIFIGSVAFGVFQNSNYTDRNTIIDILMSKEECLKRKWYEYWWYSFSTKVSFPYVPNYNFTIFYNN